MKKLGLVHFMPIEYYPPAINQLEILSGSRRLHIKVWTSKSKNRSRYFSDNIGISRSNFTDTKDSKFVRLVKYLGFNFGTFFGLMLYRPDKILYFESYSAWPVFWYVKLFGRKVELYKHCHEYFDKSWYQNGMKTVRLNHYFETRFLYRRAKWISHTNSDRLNLFKSDYPEINSWKLKVLPNYPPRKWGEHIAKINILKLKDDSKLRLVYIGSISIVDTYVKELCSFVLKHEDKMSLDIYAYNFHEEVQHYLESLNSNSIKFFSQGLDYESIPITLVQYDVGVIMYKVNSLNCNFCAPNKLFEYLACDLDVWVSKEQQGCKEFLNLESKPIVKSVDFNNLSLDALKNDVQTQSSSIPYRPYFWYYEDVFKELKQSLDN